MLAPDASGNTALHKACYEDLPRVSGRLMRLGANILAPGSEGYTSPSTRPHNGGARPIVNRTTRIIMITFVAAN